MTKVYESDLIDSVAEKFGFSKRESDDVIDFIQEWTASELKKGNSVRLNRHGRFDLKLIKGRSGIAFGKPWTTQDSYGVTFKPYGRMKHILNS